MKNIILFVSLIFCLVFPCSGFAKEWKEIVADAHQAENAKPEGIKGALRELKQNSKPQLGPAPETLNFSASTRAMYSAILNERNFSDSHPNELAIAALAFFAAQEKQPNRPYTIKEYQMILDQARSSWRVVGEQSLTGKRTEADDFAKINTTGQMMMLSLPAMGQAQILIGQAIMENMEQFFAPFEIRRNKEVWNQVTPEMVFKSRDIFSRFTDALSTNPNLRQAFDLSWGNSHGIPYSAGPEVWKANSQSARLISQNLILKEGTAFSKESYPLSIPEKDLKNDRLNQVHRGQHGPVGQVKFNTDDVARFVETYNNFLKQQVERDFRNLKQEVFAAEMSAAYAGVALFARAAGMKDPQVGNVISTIGVGALRVLEANHQISNVSKNLAGATTEIAKEALTRQMTAVTLSAATTYATCGLSLISLIVASQDHSQQHQAQAMFGMLQAISTQISELRDAMMIRFDQIDYKLDQQMKFLQYSMTFVGEQLTRIEKNNELAIEKLNDLELRFRKVFEIQTEMQEQIHKEFLQSQLQKSEIEAFLCRAGNRQLTLTSAQWVNCLAGYVTFLEPDSRQVNPGIIPLKLKEDSDFISFITKLNQNSMPIETLKSWALASQGINWMSSVYSLNWIQSVLGERARVSVENMALMSPVDVKSWIAASSKALDILERAPKNAIPAKYKLEMLDTLMAPGLEMLRLGRAFHTPELLTSVHQVKLSSIQKFKKGYVDALKEEFKNSLNAIANGPVTAKDMAYRNALEKYWNNIPGCFDDKHRVALYGPSDLNESEFRAAQSSPLGQKFFWWYRFQRNEKNDMMMDFTQTDWVAGENPINARGHAPPFMRKGSPLLPMGPAIFASLPDYFWKYAQLSHINKSPDNLKICYDYSYDKDHPAQHQRMERRGMVQLPYNIPIHPVQLAVRVFRKTERGAFAEIGRIGVSTPIGAYYPYHGYASGESSGTNHANDPVPPTDYRFAELAAVKTKDFRVETGAVEFFEPSAKIVKRLAAELDLEMIKKAIVVATGKVKDRMHHSSDPLLFQINQAEAYRLLLQRILEFSYNDVLLTDENMRKLTLQPFNSSEFLSEKGVERAYNQFTSQAAAECAERESCVSRIEVLADDAKVEKFSEVLFEEIFKKETELGKILTGQSSQWPFTTYPELARQIQGLMLLRLLPVQR